MVFISRVKEYIELVKFEHSLFALPFAISGMLLAKSSDWPEAIIFLWVIIAMISARTAAMALNRIIDRNIDMLNPRTKDRAIPSGRIKVLNATILVIISLIIMILSVFQLPLICIYLLPLAVFIIVIYSFTKRFTIFSHFVLGFVLGSAATGGWLAVSGNISWASVFWGISVIFWVAGFDIIYSLQDVNFDKQQNLYSLPAKIGVNKALIVSRFCHLMTVLFMFLVGIFISVSWFYWIAVIFVAGMLTYEQSLISSNDFSKINVAFFNVNGYLGIGILVLIIIDKFFIVYL